MDDHYQFLGIGAGPSNLSLAALNDHRPGLKSLFLDAKPAGLAWHAGLLLPESRLQTHFVKDLVTPVDPTNPFSFVSYLVKHKRLYKFLTADFAQISRVEFSDYLRWVASELKNVRHSTPVTAVSDHGDTWKICTERGNFYSPDLVVATGRSPNIPAFAQGKTSADVFHSSVFCQRVHNWRDKRVAIIGGGQSAAEILNHLLSNAERLPGKIRLISRRSNLLQLDDSPFANEWFTPEYSNYFQGLSTSEKSRHVADQKLASDGISVSLLQEIYRRLYELRYLKNSVPGQIVISVGSTVSEMSNSPQGYRLNVQSDRFEHDVDEFDVVILATGYKWALPAFLSSVQDRIEMNGSEPAVNEDFSARLTGTQDKRIFFQNTARLQRGIADPNLSLLAWRSSKVLNALARRTLYESTDDLSMLDLALPTRGIDNGAFPGGERHATTIAL